MRRSAAETLPTHASGKRGRRRSRGALASASVAKKPRRRRCHTWSSTVQIRHIDELDPAGRCPAFPGSGPPAWSPSAGSARNRQLAGGPAGGGSIARRARSSARAICSALSRRPGNRCRDGRRLLACCRFGHRSGRDLNVQPQHVQIPRCSTVTSTARSNCRRQDRIGTGTRGIPDLLQCSELAAGRPRGFAGGFSGVGTLVHAYEGDLDVRRRDGRRLAHETGSGMRTGYPLCASLPFARSVLIRSRPVQPLPCCQRTPEVQPAEWRSTHDVRDARSSDRQTHDC